MIAATSVLITKLQNAPNMNTMVEALAAMQNDIKQVNKNIQSTMATVQKTVTETSRDMKEATAIRTRTTELVQETNDMSAERRLHAYYKALQHLTLFSLEQCRGILQTTKTFELQFGRSQRIP